MNYQVDDRVVHVTHGVGRVVGLVTKSFSEQEERRYYEIDLERGTVWVPVDSNQEGELRRLTPRADLARYRAVLRSQPLELTADHRQRRVDLLARLKVGSFQEMCEVVRDLSARGWQKPLSEADSGTLRKAMDGLCQEWAATAGVSIADATREIDGLLLECREAHHED